MATARGERAATPLAGETILLVEDNAEVRRVSARRVRNLGYTVIEAENAAGAIEVLSSGRKVDLIFSDVVMPGGMSGFDLARWARQNAPSVRVLLTSGFAEDVARAGEAIAPDLEILRKPYTGDELALRPPVRSSRDADPQIRVGCLEPLGVGGEGVADAAHGLDQARMVGVGFDLLAQPSHQRIDRAVERRPIVALQQVHDVVAGQNAMRPLDEDLEQVELGGRQLLQLAALRAQLPARDVQHHAVEGIALVRRGLGATAASAAP